MGPAGRAVGGFALLKSPSPSHSDCVQPGGGEERREDLSVHTLEAAAHLVRPPSTWGAAMPVPSSPSEMTVASVGGDAGKLQPHTLLVGLSEAAATVKDDLAVPQRLNRVLSNDPAILLPSRCSEELKTCT